MWRILMKAKAWLAFMTGDEHDIFVIDAGRATSAVCCGNIMMRLHCHKPPNFGYTRRLDSFKIIICANDHKHIDVSQKTHRAVRLGQRLKYLNRHMLIGKPATSGKA